MTEREWKERRCPLLTAADRADDSCMGRSCAAFQFNNRDGSARVSMPDADDLTTDGICRMQPVVQIVAAAPPPRGILQ